jgi:hypothetical protein
MKGTSSAREFLGTEHPLVRKLDALGTVAHQSRVVGVVAVASAVAVVAGAAWADAFTIAGAAALAGLVLVAAALRQQVREQAIKLILADRDRLPVAAVQAQRRRLQATRTRRELARSLDSIVRQASKPRTIATFGMRPLFDVSVVARVTTELRTVASLLRARRAPAHGVALAERLLTDGRSSLYGREVAPLRDDLGRLQTILRAG